MDVLRAWPVLKLINLETNEFYEKKIGQRISNYLVFPERNLFCIKYSNQSLEFVDLKKLEERKDIQELIGADPESTAVSPDGSLVFAQDKEKYCHFFSLDTMQERKELGGLVEGDNFQFGKFSPDNKLFFAFYYNLNNLGKGETKEIKRNQIYDLINIKRSMILEELFDYFDTISFSNNGRLAYADTAPDNDNDTNFGGSNLVDLEAEKIISNLISGYTDVSLKGDNYIFIRDAVNNSTKLVDWRIFSQDKNPRIKKFIELYGNNIGVIFDFISQLMKENIIGSLDDFKFLLSFIKELNNLTLPGVLKLIKTSEILEFIIQNKGDIQLHLNFYLELIRNQKGSDLQTLENVFDAIRSGWISVKLEEKERKRTLVLSNAGITLLPNLLASSERIESLFNKIKLIQSEHFNIDDPVMIDLNYHLLREQTKYSFIKRKISYEEFLKVINQVKTSGIKEPDENVSEELQLKIRGIAVEADLLKEQILKIQQKATSLGREVIVIENLSNGLVYLASITEERNGSKYIVGTNIRVISAKVGSTECDKDKYYIPLNLFTPEEIEYILKKQPDMIVVDASASVSDGRTPHIPYAFKGVRNYAMAMNKALVGEIKLENLFENESFEEVILKNSRFISLTKYFTKTGLINAQALAYNFLFWYPGEKDLYLDLNKQKDVVAPKIGEKLEEIRGPSIFFVQSALAPETLQKKYKHIKKGFIKGNYVPDCFDNKEHFKEFHFAYQPGYGVILSKRMVNLSRKCYQSLLVFLEREKINLSEERSFKIGPNISVDKPLEILTSLFFVTGIIYGMIYKPEIFYQQLNSVFFIVATGGIGMVVSNFSGFSTIGVIRRMPKTDAGTKSQKVESYL